MARVWKGIIFINEIIAIAAANKEIIRSTHLPDPVVFISLTFLTPWLSSRLVDYLCFIFQKKITIFSLNLNTFERVSAQPLVIPRDFKTEVRV